MELQVEMPNRICGSGIQMRDKMDFAGDNEIFNFSSISLLEILGRVFYHQLGCQLRCHKYFLCMF